MDVKQERRIDDNWNIDGSRDLSDSWTGFTQFTLLEETSRRIYVVGGEGGRLKRKQLTSRPDHSRPELWTKLGRNAKLKEKHKWSDEKPKLDDARRLRGIYFIDPEDKEFKETIKNARKKLETPMAPAVLCKTSKKCKHGVTRGKTFEFKLKLACTWKPVNQHDCVWENLYRIIMKTILQEKETNSLQHYNLVHKFIPMPQSMKNSCGKGSCWTRNGKNWRKFPRGT